MSLGLGILENFTAEQMVVVTFFGNFGLMCCFIAALYFKVEVRLVEVFLRACLSLVPPKQLCRFFVLFPLCSVLKKETSSSRGSRNFRLFLGPTLSCFVFSFLPCYHVSFRKEMQVYLLVKNSSNIWFEPLLWSQNSSSLPLITNPFAYVYSFSALL